MVKRLFTASVAALLLISMVAGPSLAQSNEDLQAEIEALKKGQQNIQRQLAEIKRMLQAQQRPPRPSGPNVKDVAFDLSNSMVKGKGGAKLVLIEFTDYQ